MEPLNLVGHAVSNEKAKLDAGCKALLGCTAVAAFIAKHCIPEFHDMAIEDIQKCIIGTPQIGSRPVDDLPEKLNLKNAESKSVNEGTIFYDVLFDIQLPGEDDTRKVIVDIEAQNNFDPGYAILNRASYYCGRLISDQKETVFHNSDFDKLQKVYSIWLCIAPKPDARGVCNVYEMKEKCLTKEFHFPKEQYDNFSMMMVCLQDNNSENELVRLFSSVFDSDMTVEQKLHTVRESGIKVTTGIERGINNMCNYSDFIEQKALEKGTVNTFAVSVANLVKAGVLTTEKALDTLQVPDNIRAAVAEQAASLINNN